VGLLSPILSSGRSQHEASRAIDSLCTGRLHQWPVNAIYSGAVRPRHPKAITQTIAKVARLDPALTLL